MRFLSLLFIAFLFWGCRESKPMVFDSNKPDSVRQMELARQDSLRKIEQARADSLEKAVERERIANLKKIIKVQSVYTSAPNSAGGVDVHTIWTNKSKKTIKYISFEWTPYNAVGDVVYSEIGNESRKGGRVTGPIKPGQTYGYGTYWECFWYNNTIKKAMLMEIEIDYMDGTTVKIEYPDIQYVYKDQG